jgi:hypothetical protein
MLAAGVAVFFLASAAYVVTRPTPQAGSGQAR